MSQKLRWGGEGEVRLRLRFDTLDFVGSSPLFVNDNLDVNQIVNYS